MTPRRALLVVVAATAAAACSSSAPTAAPSGESSWAITYDVVETGSGTTQRQVVEIDRPYRARTRTYGPDGTLASGNVWTEAGLFLVAADGTVTEVQPVAPGRPGPDVRLDVALPLALDADLVTTSGTDVVAGVACTTWVSRAPLDGDLPAPATDDETTVSCVDARGRILRDEWSLHGEVIRTRTATGVTGPVDLTETELFGPSGPGPRPAGFTLLEVTPLGDEPPLALPFPASLAGLPRDLLVQARDVVPTSTTPLPQRLEQRATYTDGDRLVVLSQSRAVTGAEAALPTGEPVTLPPLEHAVLTIGFDGLVVVGRVGDVRVEVRGPLTRAELAALQLDGPAS